jgi:diguanylate cyclase (GGDEF)-like protein
MVRREAAYDLDFIEKTDVSPEKVALGEEFDGGTIMRSYGGGKIGVVTDAQATILAAIGEEFGASGVPEPYASELIDRAGAALDAAVVVLTKRDGGWSVFARTESASPDIFAAGGAVFDALDPGAATTSDFGLALWTVVVSAHGERRVALLVEGDWTLSRTPFVRLADAICRSVSGAHRDLNWPSPARVGRIHYRLERRLARTKGLGPAAGSVLRHATAAIAGRIGALAVMAPLGTDASVVATYGYPLALVEHVRIVIGEGVIGGVMSSRRALRVDGTTQSARGRLRYHTNSFVAVPILSGAEALGAICVTDRVDNQAFTEQDVIILRRFAASAALALERERAMGSADSYAQAAAIDPLTGIFNRRYLQVRLDEELERSRRHDIPIAVLVIDIDDFKAINDSYGHLIGDVVLKDIAEILRWSVRVFDVCARFGGEEFVIIMPGSTGGSAARIAERIRERIEAYRPADRRLGRLHVTVSIGLAVSSADTSVGQVLDRADQALYAAKHGGKNRVSADEQAL